METRLYTTVAITHTRALFGASSSTPNTSKSNSDLPAELRAVNNNRCHRTIGNLIAWGIKNPGRRGLPPNLMSKVLPEIKRAQFDSIDFKVSKPSKPLKLNGYWSPAKDPKSNKCLVVVHGQGGAPYNYLTLAKALNERAVNIFMLELRAHGKRGNDKKATIGVREGRDIVSAIKYLDQQYPNQVENLYLMGHSAGAVSIMTLPSCVSEEDFCYIQNRVKSIILDSPYRSRHSAIAQASANTYNSLVVKYIGLKKFLQKVSKAVINNLDKQAISEPFPENNPNIYPAQMMAQFPGWCDKVRLHIHGEKDREIPFADGQVIHDTFNNAGDLFSLPDTDHVGKQYLVKKRYPLKSKVVLRGPNQNVFIDKIMGAIQDN